MRISYGIPQCRLEHGCAVAVGDFDGVHRGHQALLAVLRNEAQRRGLRSCVVLFEPMAAFARLAPARVTTLRDKLSALAACGVDHCVVLPTRHPGVSIGAQELIERILVAGLDVRYLLVGGDLRWAGAESGIFEQLCAAGGRLGFEVACLRGYDVRGVPVCAASVRQALAKGDLQEAAMLLGRRYAVSGHVVHGRKLGRVLGFRTLNLRVGLCRPAASGVFVARVFGLAEAPLPGVANLGVRPSLDPCDVNGGRVLLETHCLTWPVALGTDGAYGKVVRVELLCRLHAELKYPSLESLQKGIARDRDEALAFFADRQECITVQLAMPQEPA